MLSREKGQSVATRPVADADADETEGESPADGPPAGAGREVGRGEPGRRGSKGGGGGRWPSKPPKNAKEKRPPMDRRRAPRVKWPEESPSRRVPEQTRSSGFASKEGGTKCECGWPRCVGWGSPSGGLRRNLRVRI